MPPLIKAKTRPNWPMLCLRMTSKSKLMILLTCLTSLTRLSNQLRNQPKDHNPDLMIASQKLEATRHLVPTTRLKTTSRQRTLSKRMPLSTTAVALETKNTSSNSMMTMMKLSSPSLTSPSPQCLSIQSRRKSHKRSSLQTMTLSTRRSLVAI